MDALNKQGANNGVSFFTSLRRLGKDVDLGVRDIHSKLDADSDRKQSCDDRRLALKGLRDRKKDVESVKGNASNLLKELRHGGREFEQTLQVCSGVIDTQLKQLSSIQAYLTQYGFVPQQEPESEEASEESTSDTNAAGDNPYPFILVPNLLKRFV
ncbi:uncharacterized protein [Littorina saxatilis]|uniref:uncharacterized protein n=1 Tax=Littorina saxatilis TaxID=31220 RepID=UPI0038B472EF